MSTIDKNKSYTNKDFQAIYDELLDLIPTLTNKWNPTNEADPGVVLTKLMAVLGDKLNYNIDKQILECFPASVTQRKNARQIYDLIGYKMKLYRSAVADINFKLKSQTSSDITVPKFTQLTDVNNTVSFITLEDIKLFNGDINTSYSVKAIQGYYNELTVNGNTNISIINLDENFRIYFSDMNIAENGIFISDSSSNVYDWEQVDNVSSYPLGSKVFEFGVSNDETTCYIQFPSDINQLITRTDAINIKYITTLGTSGNILSYVLDTFGDSIVDEYGETVETKIAITQPLGTINGTDPESIEDAYKNSRKIVNTFETLITRLDYENYIKTLKSNDKEVVANAVVCDRTNDLNQTIEVITLKNGQETTVKDYGDLTPYDIVLYLLDNNTSFDRSFSPIKDETKVLQIENLIDDIKAINLNYLLPEGSSSNPTNYLYKGIYKLNGQIISSEKLTRAEADQLEQKISSALQTLYSSKNVNFGERINYNKLLENIQAMDSRIKAIVLDPPSYVVNKVTSESDAENLLEEDKIEMVAKMVAKGNLQFYIFDESFKKEFGQEDSQVIKDITEITSTASITLSTTAPYELKKNEIIDLYAPNYIVTKEYSTGCKIQLKNKDEIKKEEHYRLQGDEYLNISYTDTSGVVVNEIIKDTIIQCSQDLTVDKSILLSANSGYLKIYERNESNLSKNTPVIFVLDNESLTIGAGQSYVLGTNEYMLYSNKATTEIIRLGAGVLLENNTEEDLEITNAINSITPSSEVLENLDFKLLTVELKAVDQEIISINEGCRIHLQKESGNTDLTLSNADQLIPNDCKVNITDSSGTYSKDKNPAGDSYSIRSRLAFLYIDEPVILLNNQSIIFKAQTNTTVSGTSDGVLLQFNQSFMHTGGIKLVNTGDILNAYKYIEGIIPDKEDGKIKIEYSAAGTTLNFNFASDSSVLKYLIPIQVVGDASATVTIVKGSTAVYDMSTFTIARTNVYEPGDYILEVDKTGSSLKFTLNNTGAEVLVGDIYPVSKINTDELSGDGFVVANTESSGTDIAYKIIDKINTLIPNVKYNYLHTVDNLNKCPNPSTAESFFNHNHLYNRFTIPMLDTKNTTIKVNQFSVR